MNSNTLSVSILYFDSDINEYHSLDKIPADKRHEATIGELCFSNKHVNIPCAFFTDAKADWLAFTADIRADKYSILSCCTPNEQLMHVTYIPRSNLIEFETNGTEYRFALKDCQQAFDQVDTAFKAL